MWEAQGTVLFLPLLLRRPKTAALGAPSHVLLALL
jgi:hypothetical protein